MPEEKFSSSFLVQMSKEIVISAMHIIYWELNEITSN